MTTFRTYVRRVRDPSLPVVERRRALGGCVAAFHPYGYRATWEKVVSGRRIAAHRHGSTRVPDLLAAVGELEEARWVWRVGGVRYAERRRREKAAGVRVPRAADRWPEPIAYCPDASLYPPGPMPEVLARVIAARAAGAPGCPNCGGRERVDPGGSHCPACGIRF